MRLKRFFLWIPLALVLVLGGFGLWLFNTDLGRFKPTIERIVSEQLGREVRIEGELDIFLGEFIEISVRGLRLANPEWAVEPDLAAVEALDVSIDLWSLLEGPVLIESLRVASANFYGEISEEGEESWDLEGLSTEASAIESTDALVLMRHMSLEDIRFSLQGPDRLDPLVIEVDQYRLEHQADDMLDISIVGEIGGQPFEYRGEIGTFDNLLQGRDIRYQGDGLFGSLDFEAEGFIDDVAAPRFPALKILVSGPEFTDVMDMLGLDNPISGPYRVHAVGERSGDVMGLSLEMEIGPMQLEAHGHSAGIMDFSRIEYEVSGHGPDLGAFTRLFGAGAWPEEPFSISGSVGRRNRQVDLEDITLTVGETRFYLNGHLSAFPQLNEGSVELNVAGDDVAKFRELMGFEGHAQGDFAIDVVLDADRGEGQQFQAHLETSLGKLDAAGKLGEWPSYVGSRITASLSGNDTEALLDGYGLPGFPAEPFTLEGTFQVREDGIEFEQGMLATLQDDRLGFQGFINYAPLEPGTDLQIKASGDDLSQFAPMTGLDAPLPAQPYELNARFRTTPAGYRVDDLKGRVGANQIAFDGLISKAPDFGGTDFTFRIQGSDMETLVRDTARFNVPAEPFDIRGHVRHLRDALRLEAMRAQIGDFSARAEIEARLPWEGAHASFDIELAGPDVNFILPEHPRLELVSHPFEMHAKGAMDDGAWRFERAEARVHNARFSISGVFDELPDFSATDILFSLDIPSQRDLGSFKGVPFPDLPVSIDGHMTGSQAQVRIDDLAMQLGNSDVAGVFVVDYTGDVPRIELRTHSRLLDMRDMLGQLGLEDVTSEDQVDDGRLIPDWPFPLDELAAINIDADITVDEFRSRKRIYSNYVLQASLDNGALAIERMRAEGLEGFFELSASLTPVGSGNAELKTALDLQGLKLNLSRDDVVDESQLPVLTFDVDISGVGPGLRDVMSTSNGHIYANGTSGLIPNSALSFLDKGLLEQVFGAILPKTEQSERTNLQCFAMRLDIEDGRVQAAPGVAIVTDKVQMISKGTINLKNEKLNLTFETRPSKAFQANVSEVLINPFVKISGTLDDPQLSFDAARGLLYGGAAIGTAGLSILAKGLWDRMSASADPCEQFTESDQ